MSTDVGIPPKYDPVKVGQSLLFEVIEQHPAQLTVEELALRIVTDPDDSKEVMTATRVIRDLRRSGLFLYRDDDEIVEPTPAALHAYALLTAS